MSISRKLAPQARTSASALLRVRPVVPTQGIVMPRMPSSGSFCSRIASMATRKASVLSSPPDMPTTSFFMPVLRMRWARPVAWMRAISAQRALRTGPSGGTKGNGSAARGAAAGCPSAGAVTVRQPSAASLMKEFWRRRSLSSACRSITAVTTAWLPSGKMLSASTAAFSQIRLWPEKTTSVVLSSCPALA